MSTVQRIVSFLSAELHAGRRCVLVTVTDVSGASMRNPGAHMAVSATGDFVGSLSGGCIERAVVTEALEVLAEGRPRRIAYGSGSPIIDIRLPCGGRVDLLFNPLDDPQAVDALITAHAGRHAVGLVLPTGGDAVRLGEEAITGWRGDTFHVREAPPLRLVIFGDGAAPEALVDLSRAMDVETHVLSPDAEIVARLKAGGAPAQLLKQPSGAALPDGDAWTAYVCLFHDHDWEENLLAAALLQPSLYIGAMGSRRTHAARLTTLRARGLAERDLQRIEAPIGLIPSSRDPQTLALSILAQAVDRYNAAEGRFKTIALTDDEVAATKSPAV